MEESTLEPQVCAATSYKSITVEVRARPDGANGVTWSHEIEEKGHDKGGKVDLPKDSGPYKITFDLDDYTRLKLRFDAGGPFFCSEDNATCPDGIHSDQITVDSCNSGKLVVIDWNYGDERELRYQMNFVNDKGEAMPCYDPIILNGGGIRTFI